VNDKSTPNHVSYPTTNRNGVGLKTELCLSRSVGDQARQITCVVFVVIVRTMRLGRGIEVPSGADSVTTAAVTLLVNMETMDSTWLETLNLACHQNFVSTLGELHRANDRV
jgi:hypothetical protein